MKSIYYVKNNFDLSNYKKIFKKLTYSNKGIKRICFHKSEKSLIHIMMIDTLRDFPYPKHAHLDSNELITVFDGKLKIEIFNKKKKKVTKLLKKNDQIFINANTPHTTLPITRKCVYLEFKLGPFKRNKIKYFL